MTNFLRRDRRIMSNARLRATRSAVKILAWLVIRKLFTISPLTAAAAVPLLVLDPSVYIWQKPCSSSQISRNLPLKTTAFVSDSAKLFKDKSTNGLLRSQCLWRWIAKESCNSSTISIASFASSVGATGLRQYRITSPVTLYLPVHICSLYQTVVKSVYTPNTNKKRKGSLDVVGHPGNQIDWLSEWVSSFLTAHQHN